MKHEKNYGRLNVRCTVEEQEVIKNMCKERGITLHDYLIRPALGDKSRLPKALDLDTISVLSIAIEDKLQTEADKQIYKEGMERIWKELIKN